MQDRDLEDDNTSTTIEMPAEHARRCRDAGRKRIDEATVGLAEISRRFIRSVASEGTVLLLEEDAPLRDRLVRYFAGIGCRVFPCATMEEAEGLLLVHGEIFDYFIFQLVKEGDRHATLKARYVPAA